MNKHQSIDVNLIKLEKLTDPKRPITYGVVKPGPEDPITGVVFIRGGDISKGLIKEASLRTITQEVSRPYGRTILRGGEVVMSLVGNPGEVAIVPDRLAGANLARQAGLIALRPEIHAPYVKYYLMSPAGRSELFQRTQGAVQQVINLSDLKQVKVRLPSRQVQERIADILSAYDDLIENNRRRIKLLEEAAGLLYREWFVHFRFPGYEHVEIADGLPDGWRRRPLVELAEIIMGQSPKSQFYNDDGDGLPFHQGVTDFGFRFVSHRIFSTAVTKLAEGGDILISVRAPVGRINVTRDNIVIGRGLAAIRSRTEHQSFLLYALKNRFYTEDIIGTGSIYAGTNKKELENQVVIDPSEIILKQFEEQTRTIDQCIANLSIQNDRLTGARDLLLPRLMNGDIAG